MQKKRYTKNIGILLSNETYYQLVEVTDREEITISKFIRQLIEERLNSEGREKNNER
jgi:macrodomain Ter protein organizer (MatP/YcbG family)